VPQSQGRTGRNIEGRKILAAGAREFLHPTIPLLGGSGFGSARHFKLCEHRSRGSWFLVFQHRWDGKKRVGKKREKTGET